MACLVEAEEQCATEFERRATPLHELLTKRSWRKMSFWKSAAAAAARKQIGMRVLVVEDDSAIARSVELILKSESFNVYATEFGEQGVDLGKHYFYDIILLDLSLPDMSGFEVLQSLRASKVKTPILILSGIASIENKVKGLGFGADDYMTKPFHKSELLARIHAIIRRSQNHSQSVVQTGDLIVNLDAKTVEVQGERVHLTVKEYQMLELLSLRKGSTLTKEMFLNQLYGGMDEPGIKIIDIFLCKIRKKLARASNGKNYIETVCGRGYLLREPHEIPGEVGRDGVTAPARQRDMLGPGAAGADCDGAADRSGAVEKLHHGAGFAGAGHRHGRRRDRADRMSRRRWTGLRPRLRA
jgi:two-component system, cell cycle response regulator CtrA